jgi:hypothetical protein
MNADNRYSNSLVQRLREFMWPRVNYDFDNWDSEPLCLEAADEIERLRAALERIAIGSACDDPACTSMFHEGCDAVTAKDKRYKAIARRALGMEAAPPAETPTPGANLTAEDSVRSTAESSGPPELAPCPACKGMEPRGKQPPCRVCGGTGVQRVVNEYQRKQARLVAIARRRIVF